ncbi:MAG: TIGR04283 family arsenosugar biosynthesis glycosyltransferase [Verrucomicrobiia bacterium]
MNGKRQRLILFARYPVAGRVKTRLIPALGPEGAAALHRRLVLRTLRAAEAWRMAADADLEIRFDGGSEEAMRHWLGDGWRCRPQGEGDLGERMARAFADSFREDCESTVLIGSDCPALSHESLAAAFAGLSRNRVVLGPATDGGYYLVGMTQSIPELFRGVEWGTETVLKETLRILERLALQPFLLERRDDVDRPEDLISWRRTVEEEEADMDRVSVIIPTLNEAPRIAASIESARRGNPLEIIVVDGGSSDGTVQFARDGGTTVICTMPGRARQMNAGAARATGNALLFLHSDTLLPPHYPRVVSQTLRASSVAAGAFRLSIEGAFSGKRLVEWGINFRSRWLQKPYGDQAIFLRRALFEELGGFANQPFLEDVELVCRLRRLGRIVVAPQTVCTSGRRWQQLGALRTILTNQFILTAYALGVSPETLARLYSGSPANAPGRLAPTPYTPRTCASPPVSRR